MESPEKRRVYAIDILKVIAVFVVMNSHMEICYEKYSFLATGGAVGDALFFFCSGFTLLLGEVKSFPNYYKKRLSRIYPTILSVAIFSAVFFSEQRPLIAGIIFGGGWFVNCILIYYIPLYFVRRYGMNSFRVIWLITFLVIILAFLFIFRNEHTSYFLYGKTYFKWIHYFLFMLYGAYVGCHHNNYHYSHWCIPKLLICLTIWYSFFFLSDRIPWINNVQFISLIPLLGTVHYLYILCCNPVFTVISEGKVSGQLVFIIGSLCLESYLIQSYLFTDKFNVLFPLNIPIVMLIVLIVAYFVNIVSNLISQTFKNEDYDYRKLFLYKRN